MARRPRRSAADREQARRRGALAEAVCAGLLRLKGYRVLARNQRTPVGEIDILARRGATLVLVEVKYRAQLAGAASALSPRQRRRLQRAGDWALGRYSQPGEAGLSVRFDVMLVARWRFPRHIRNAFL